MSETNHLKDDEITVSDFTNSCKASLQTCASEQSIKDPNLTSSAFDSSDDESGMVRNTKKRMQRFSDSDSDTPKEICDHAINYVHSHENSENEDYLTSFKSTSNKSRIRKMSVSEEDDLDTEQEVSKNKEQQLRMKNKNQMLTDKFKSLVESRDKDIKNIVDSESSVESSDDGSNSTKDNMSSIDKIKKKIDERMASLKTSICDPDTSDEESNQNKKVKKLKKERPRKTKLTSPKPQRMSAKQAMENMQKIKSESNRMLREKEVSLPYHRPKALSLQDIMKRRQPAISSDGKALPIKMNEEQLKQYVLLLEQRQKEMIELCKSDTEEDEPNRTNSNSDNNVSSDTVPDDSVSNKKRENTCDEPSEEFTEIVQNETDETVTENTEESSQPKDKDFENTSAVKITDNIISVSDFKNKSGDESAEIELVYNDSIEEENKLDDVSAVDTNNLKESVIEKNADQNISYKQELLASSNENDHFIQISKEVLIDDNKLDISVKDNEAESAKQDSEMESQLISLRYFDSEKAETNNSKGDEVLINKMSNEEAIATTVSISGDKKSVKEVGLFDLDDEDMGIDDINMDEIDSIIENSKLINNTCNRTNSPVVIKDVLSVKPKLTGAPGMFIDLDGTDPIAPKKLSGVELLKERFTFFAKLKTPEEMERQREKIQKPGTQHLKLKQELEDKIAEQRSLEWAKRLENEKLHQKESSALRGDESEQEDDIEKLELKLDENYINEESSSEGEEEPIENDVLLKDKPKKKNPLVADEAEESDVDETEDGIYCKETKEVENEDGVDGDDEDDVDKNEEDSSEDEESSESELEIESDKPKKGRILKAFEDSDDEETLNIENDRIPAVNANVTTSEIPLMFQSQGEVFTDSQDDVLQLAQIPKQISGELFTSPDCGKSEANANSTKDEELLGTQTFSILNTNTSKDLDVQLEQSEKLTVISDTQPCDGNLDAVVGMCSGSFTQNYVEFQPPSTQSQLSQSQPIGEDLLNMCTGNFYDNQFVTPHEENDKLNTSDISQDPTNEPCFPKSDENNEKDKIQAKDILKSVLDELNEPDTIETKPLKFFFDNKNQNKENEQNTTNTQLKKRFVIDSDDETNDIADSNSEHKKNKKFKKKKLEDRALQISDDEDEVYSELEEEDEYLSERENEEEKLVEYDSEENEVEIKPQIVKKKKKKASEFFEQEAELTSEDEWVGSGDEDEAGLDRMEREAGDDDTFNQGRLQRELGQIHMRDVLDQDKREVRLIQELLFEDGDLGAGGRQRKFRWRNADGEEASGTVPDEFADTQEEEFESEEQWRKQRHEREMFLRQMKNEGEKEEDLSVSVNRSTIIKANLTSRTMSSLLEEVNQTKTEESNTSVVPEKKATKDILSTNKPFTLFQQNYHGSLLTRGRGALARLAALATPLVSDDDAPKAGVRASASNRNFVFAAITPEDVEPKVTKRKAEINVGTPRLVKKIKTEEKKNFTKNSLLDHMKA